VLGNDFYQPIAGGPPLSGIIAITVLPPVAAWLTSIPLKMPGAVPNEGSIGAAEHRGVSAIRKLPHVFWRFLAVIFIFTLSTSLIHSYYIMAQAPHTTLLDARIIMLFRLVFALALLLVSIRFLRNIPFDRIYLLTMAVISVVLAVTPLIGLNNRFISDIIAFSTYVFDVAVWSLLAFIVFKQRYPSAVIFGFGKGIGVLGSFVGWISGASLLPSLGESLLVTIIFVALALIVAVSSIIVFTDKRANLLFGVLPEQDISIGESMVKTSKSQLDRTNQSRPWIAACRRVSSQGRLTNREAEILEQLSLGRTPESISQHLCISLKTVRTHTHNVYTKLGVHSRQELVNLIERERLP
jgi:DNA-binding CsgD family transcriptional regulator